MMLSEIKPMIVPVTTPDRTKTGKYTNIFILLIIRAAVRICPKLCATPPEILTPSILKYFIFFIISMDKKLNIPPASE